MYYVTETNTRKGIIKENRSGYQKLKCEGKGSTGGPVYKFR